MRVEQIRHAVEAAKTGSINKAAQNLFMAQSSLSSSIGSLEKELQRKVFDRSRNKLEVTDFGAKFIAEGEELLKHYDIILDLAGNKGIYAAEHFGISVYYLLFATTAFTEMCNAYDAKGEHVNFEFREQPRMNIIEDVAGGISEIGVLTMPSIRKQQWLSLFDAYNLEYHVLSEEPPYVIFGERTELFRMNCEEIDIGFFENKRMLVGEDKNELIRSIEREITQKFRFGSYLGVCDRGSYTTVLKQTDSYYIVTTNRNAYRDGTFYEGLRSIPVTGMGDFHFEIAYTKRRGVPLTRIGHDYIERLKRKLET